MEPIKLLSVFMVLFAVIDIVGVLPVLVDIQKGGKKIDPYRTTAIAAAIMFSFLFGGELLLNLFQIDFSSFAVAGSIVLFFVAMEMVLGFGIFKHDASPDATIIPVAFPLIAGPGSITTLISLRAEYAPAAISVALVANLIIVFVVIKLAVPLERLLGATLNYVLKKFFGVILLAMAIKLFTSNIGVLMGGL